MGSRETSSCPVDLAATRDVDPYPAYDRIRAEGKAVWSDSVDGWLITSYEECRNLLRGDDVLLRHPDRESREAVIMSGGRRALKMLEGAEHHAFHKWWLRILSGRENYASQRRSMAAIVDKYLGPIAQKGSTEIVSEFADQVPIRAIASMFDLPWQDDGWIVEVRGLIRESLSYFDHRLDTETTQTLRSAKALERVREMIVPYVVQGREDHGDGVIARLWRDGPRLLDDFGLDDVFAMMYSTFTGGTDTTAQAIANMTYVYATDEHVSEQLRQDRTMVPDFVEECLRLHPPVHYRQRRLNQDSRLGEVVLHRDEDVIPILAAANRDPAHYEHPQQFFLNRPSPRDHLTFSYGPRICVGAGFARNELNEVMSQMLRRIPDFRLDETKPAPRLEGLTLRSYRPVHIVFTPEGGSAT
jgi:cytochrome P450